MIHWMGQHTCTAGFCACSLGGLFCPSLKFIKLNALSPAPSDYALINMINQLVNTIPAKYHSEKIVTIIIVSCKLSIKLT